MKYCNYLLFSLFLIPLNSTLPQNLPKDEMVFIIGMEKTVNFTKIEKKKIIDVCVQNGKSADECNELFQYIFKINQYYFKVDSFYIDKYPISIKSFFQYMDSINKTYPNFLISNIIKKNDIKERLSEYPAFGMNWYEADGYCKSLGKRLPSSNEYLAVMYKGEVFPFDNYKIYNTRVRNKKDDFLLEPIGNNSLDVGNGGIVDVYGNLIEWTCTNRCQSFSHKQMFNVNFRESIPDNHNGETIVLFGFPSRQHVLGKASCSSEDAILKGGSYASDIRSLFIFNEEIIPMKFSAGIFGFRCARDAFEAQESNNSNSEQ